MTAIAPKPVSGPASGDLTGTYPAPTIASEAITTAKLADSSVTGVKLAASITGAKSFVEDLTTNGLKLGRGGGSIGSNIAFGSSALNANTTGNYNSALGYQALKDNTTGVNLTALGGLALNKNTDGVRNTAIGVNALRDNTTGDDNTSVGTNNLRAATTADANTAVGSFAMMNATTGGNNVALGMYALHYLTTGTYNNAIGRESQYRNVSGQWNSSMGADSLHENVSGQENNAIGVNSIYSNLTGNYNNALGNKALHDNIDGEYNNAVGYNALFCNTTGDKNQAVGSDALFRSTSAVATLGTITGGSGYTNGTYSSVQLMDVTPLDPPTPGTGELLRVIVYPTATITVSGGAVTGVSLETYGSGFDAGRELMVPDQVVTVDATGGTFTLTVGGDTTAPIAYDATAADMVAALEATSYVGSGDVAVTLLQNGPTQSPHSGIWQVVFKGALASVNVALMTANASSLTGGAATATVDAPIGTTGSGFKVPVATLTVGDKNTAIGHQAGYSGQTGSGSVFIGYQAGFYETGSDKLYIANSFTSSPLIGGDFAAKTLSFSGNATVTSQDTAAQGLIVKGKASQSADLQQWRNSSNTVLAKVTAAGNFEVTGSTTLAALTASGATSLTAAGTALAVTNNATVGGTLGVTGTTTLGAVTSSGAVSLTGSGTALSVTNNATIGGTLGVTGTTSAAAVTASGTLTAGATGKTAITVSDSGSQNSGLTIGGDTNLYRSAADTLKTDDDFVSAATITGNALASTTSISAASLSLTGAATVGTTLGVTGSTTLAGLTASGAASFTAAGTGLAVTNNVTVGGTLGVTGTSSYADTASFTKATGTGLAVTNNATVGGTLGVTGTSSFADTGSFTKASGTGLSVTSNATVGGTLSVTGASTLAGVTASGAVSLTSAGTALSVTNNATVGGTLGVTGTSTLGAVNSSGAVSLTASGTALAVTNNATVGGTLGVTGVLTASGSVTASPDASNVAYYASGGYFRVQRASSINAAYWSWVTNDTNARCLIDAAGLITWGSGSASGDTTLYRSAANVLKTDDQFVATDGLTTRVKAGVVADTDFTATPASGTIAVDTTNSRIYVRVGSTWKYATLT